MASKKENQKKKVLVAMSGGVDSSVAAALLLKQGYDVEGAYMQCWSSGPYCSTETDRADALRVATALNIPFRVFDFEKEYEKEVLSYFFSEYEAGRTPNPDVACNREIKFGIFLKQALDLGFDYIATGHYVRIQQINRHLELYSGSKKMSKPVSQQGGQVRHDRVFKLLKGIDPDKDQSYFLYTLGQEQLKHALFPIGSYLKKEIREIASSLGLVVANKKDSQGICFIGPVNVSKFLRQNIKTKLGDIVTSDGRLLGKHDGLAFYTIGQREGIKINSNLPHYVIGKEASTNRLVVEAIGSKAIYSSQTRLSNISWVSGQEPDNGLRCQVALRYHQKPQEVILRKVRKDWFLDFVEPQRAVTQGQAAVFFFEDEVLGGGTIEQST